MCVPFFCTEEDEDEDEDDKRGVDRRIEEWETREVGNVERDVASEEEEEEEEEEDDNKEDDVKEEDDAKEEEEKEEEDEEEWTKVPTNATVVWFTV